MFSHAVFCFQFSDSPPPPSAVALKYTDIDYVVYTDAARFMHAGGSPYERATYRYSPLLAWMLIPNISLHPLWGKMIFLLFDMIAGFFIYRILRGQKVEEYSVFLGTVSWLLNPFVINMSTRGSFEAITCAGVLAVVLACHQKRYDTAAVL